MHEQLQMAANITDVLNFPQLSCQPLSVPEVTMFYSEADWSNKSHVKGILTPFIVFVDRYTLWGFMETLKVTRLSSHLSVRHDRNPRETCLL